MKISLSLAKYLILITFLIAILNIAALTLSLFDLIQYHWILPVLLESCLLALLLLYTRKNKGFRTQLTATIAVVIIFLLAFFMVSEIFNPKGFFGIERVDIADGAVHFDFDNASAVLAERKTNKLYPGVLDNITNMTFSFNPKNHSLRNFTPENSTRFDGDDYYRTVNETVPETQTQDKITYVVRFRTDSDSDEWMGLFSNQMDWDSNSIQVKEGAILFKQAIKDANDNGAGCNIRADKDYTDGKPHTAVFSIDANSSPDCRAYVDDELIGTHDTDAAEGHFWWENWEGFVIGATVGTENRTLRRFYDGEILNITIYNDSLDHEIRPQIVLKGSRTAEINGEPESVEGKYGEALYFDGYSNIQINYSYQPKSFTQMAWIYSENDSFGHTNIDYEGRWITRNDGEIGGLNLMGNGDVGYRLQYSDDTKIHHRPAKISTGKWHHLAATFDNKTYELKIFLDGELQGTKQLDKNASLKEWKKIYIGGSGSYWYTGKVDELRVYEKALDEADLNAIQRGKEHYFMFDHNAGIAFGMLLVLMTIVLSFVQWKNDWRKNKKKG